MAAKNRVKQGAAVPRGELKGWQQWLLLIALYVIGAAVYNIIISYIRREPIVVIDESLYTNIARSLAAGQGIAYRAQPINYPYILYSLVLVPVYWVQGALGGDIYRYIQVFNTLLITASCFPVFLLGRSYTGSSRKGLIAAGIMLLMPDMLMGGFEMAEALIWPLALTMMLLLWELIEKGKLPTGIFAGILSGLLFASKPGAVAMGMAALLAVAVLYRRSPSRRNGALAGIGAGVIVIAAVYLIYVLVFGYSFSLLGLYEKQTSGWTASHALAALCGILLMAFAFAFAGGGLFTLLPYARLKDYSDNRRRMIIASTIGLAVLVIGTAVMVVPYGWDGDFSHIPLHLRYISMYLPVWIIFTMAVGEEKKPFGRMWPVLTVVFIILCIFPGIRWGFSSGTGCIDSLMLDIFRKCNAYDGTTPGVLITIAVAVFMACSYLFSYKGYRGVFRTVSTALLAVMMAVCTVCACLNIHVTVTDEDAVIADAQELNTMLSGEGETLGIIQEDYADIYSYWEESRLTKPMQQVTSDQIASAMMETGGVYEPFVPVDQSPNVSNGLTPDTDTIVLGQSIAEHLELSDSVACSKTANGIYTVCHITEGERWLDTFLYGMQENVLYEGNTAMLLIFGGREGAMTLTMDLQAFAEDTVITVEQNGSTQSFTVNGAEVLTVELEDSSIVNISANASIEIYSYMTENQ